MSTLKTTNLQNASAASPGLVLNTDGTCSQLGFRNAIINGNPIINQRGYVSGTATSGANQYTLDRWRVVTSGQSITFTDSDNTRTVTAPAGGVEQVIEGINILSGTYTLNWTGTATATVDGAAVVKGGNVTLTGGTNATVRFSSGTFSLAQLEPGTVATPFERRSYGQELALCQRYFQLLQHSYGTGNGTSSIARCTWPLKVTMRANMTLAVIGTPNWFFGGGTATYSSVANNYSVPEMAQADVNVTGGSSTLGSCSSSSSGATSYFTASAEL